MVRIVSVRGDVLVGDPKRDHMQSAQAGMMLPMREDSVVVTNNMSSAKIDIDGEIIELGPQSCLHLRPDGRTWWAKHGLAYGGDARLFVGNVWNWIVTKTGAPTTSQPTGNSVPPTN